ncbi:MAG: hypothetical protein IPL22_23310 [Bacteroidetes bacterium]|nr:hypothetical protein [Bacteroidota bacterium]
MQNLLFPVNLRFNVEVNGPDSYRENRCPYNFQFLILPLQNLLFPVNLRFNVEVNDPDSYRENRCPFISIYISAVAEFTLSG